MPNYDYNDYNDEPEEDISRRFAWEITSWILMTLTLVLNLAVILILLVRDNAYTVVNKGKNKCLFIVTLIHLLLMTSVKIATKIFTFIFLFSLFP